MGEEDGGRRDSTHLTSDQVEEIGEEGTWRPSAQMGNCMLLLLSLSSSLGIGPTSPMFLHPPAASPLAAYIKLPYFWIYVRFGLASLFEYQFTADVRSHSQTRASRCLHSAFSSHHIPSWRSVYILRSRPPARVNSGCLSRLPTHVRFAIIPPPSETPTDICSITIKVTSCLLTRVYINCIFETENLWQSTWPLLSTTAALSLHSCVIFSPAACDEYPGKYSGRFRRTERQFIFQDVE